MENSLGSHFFIQKPCKRIIRYNGSNYFLSLPYCVFNFYYVDEMHNIPVAMGFCLSDGKEIFKSPIPNSSLFYCCLGDQNKQLHNYFDFKNGKLKNERKNLKRLTDHMISVFWQSDFNDDYDIDCCSYYNYLGNIYEWHLKTKEKGFVPKSEDLKKIKYDYNFTAFNSMKISEKDFNYFREKILKSIQELEKQNV